MFFPLFFIEFHRFPLVSHLAFPSLSLFLGNALQSATKPRERGGGYEENLRIRRWPWPRQRQASNELGQGDSCACPTCGQTFPTAETLRSHCRYSAASDQASGMPKEACHKELSGKEIERLTHRALGERCWKLAVRALSDMNGLIMLYIILVVVNLSLYIV